MTAKTILVFFLLLCCAVPAQAERMGPKAVEHTLLGAGAGTLVGASAGLCAYGASKNRNADPIVADAIYGLVGGALAGAGGLVVENDLPAYVYGYTAAGAGMGAVGGVFFAMFVWALSIPGGGEVENFYQGSTGAGIGALVGATLGLGAAIVQFNLHPPAEAANITLTLEVQPHLYRLAEQPQALPQLLWACTMIEIDF